MFGVHSRYSSSRRTLGAGFSSHHKHVTVPWDPTSIHRYFGTVRSHSSQWIHALYVLGPGPLRESPQRATDRDCVAGLLDPCRLLSLSSGGGWLEKSDATQAVDFDLSVRARVSPSLACRRASLRVEMALGSE